MKTPLIFAHRGASHDAPENTLAAFALGWTQEADGLELDIHLTKDGQIAVIHDSGIYRTTGSHGEVADMTLAELQEFSVGRWKSAAFSEEKIPALDDVLEKLPDGKMAFIEIKCGPEIIEPLYSCLQRRNLPPEQLRLQSFDHDVIKATKRMMPNIRACRLAGNQETDLSVLLDKVCADGLDGLNLDWKCPITQELVERARSFGMEMHIWTVNAPEIAIRLAGLGVNGLLTDRPGWIRKQLAAK